MELLLLLPSLVPLPLKIPTSSTSSSSITPRCSTRTTGPPTRSPDLTITIAPSPSLTTGRVLNNALNPGNAEVPVCAKEVDGALASMAVKVLPSQPRPQVSPTPTEQFKSEFSQVKISLKLIRKPS